MGLHVIEINIVEANTKHYFPQYYFHLIIKYI